MMPHSSDIQRWTDVALHCTQQLATDLLGVAQCSVVGPVSAHLSEAHGAYVSLTGESATVNLGLFSDSAGARHLARALLQMEEEDEELEDGDVDDAVGELANVLGGSIKGQLTDAASSKLGLPVSLRGQDHKQTSDDAAAVALRFDDISVLLVVELFPCSSALPCP